MDDAVDLRSVRHQYEQDGLDVSDVEPDPILQFRLWFEAWAATGPRDPGLMVLATVDEEGWPASRAVLLRGLDDRGFVFFTNHTSDKGRALDATQRASLSVVWHDLERQVRVVGEVARVADEESDAYFAGRPRGSQIGAWASDQSAILPDRATLEERVAEIDARFPGEVPRPPHWGGYRIRPCEIEFWQGRPSRLHDRVRYRLAGSDEPGEGVWIIERLAP